MADSQLPSATDAGDALTLLEKLVEVRLLVLALAGVFYLDLWALRADVDPTLVTLQQLGRILERISVFTIATFFLSFSMLIGAFFPAIRSLVGLVRLHFFNSELLVREDRNLAARRLSDWSLALVSISLYDLFAGLQAAQTYKGLSWYLVQVFGGDSFETILFRATAAIFWLVCVALALEVDI